MKDNQKVPDMLLSNFLSFLEIHKDPASDMGSLTGIAKVISRGDESEEFPVYPYMASQEDGLVCSSIRDCCFLWLLMYVLNHHSSWKILQPIQFLLP